MNMQTLKRYPRLIAVMLAIAGETDVSWATSVIDTAKNRRTPMSQGLVREAYRKRHEHNVAEATRNVGHFLTRELAIA